MESRDVYQGPIVEPHWLDVDTAAQYLCMSRHSLCRVCRPSLNQLKTSPCVLLSMIILSVILK